MVYKIEIIFMIYQDFHSFACDNLNPYTDP